MYVKKIPINFECSLDLVAEVLYGKWKIRLLFFINDGCRRPSELHNKITEASKRVLNVQLKELERHQLIWKKVYPIFPAKVEYQLTELGESLIPIIKSLGNWGCENEMILRNLKG